MKMLFQVLKLHISYAPSLLQFFLFTEKKTFQNVFIYLVYYLLPQQNLSFMRADSFVCFDQH